MRAAGLGSLDHHAVDALGVLFPEVVAEAGDVVLHRAGEQGRVLRQVTDVARKPLAVPILGLGAVETDHALIGLAGARDHTHQGGFSRPARADDADHLAGSHDEADLAQDHPVARGRQHHHPLDR